MTVPTSDNCGCSIRGDFGGGGALTTATGTSLGGGGRRDGEKIGRSRVFDKVVSGMAHSGLALMARSAATCGGTKGRIGPDAGPAGESHTDGTAGPSGRRSGSGSSSDVAVGSAMLDAGTLSTAMSSRIRLDLRRRIVVRLLISRPAIDRRPRAEF
jgi:hypothetical protein